MAQSFKWYTWRPGSKAKLKKAEENMLKGERQIILYVYLQNKCSAKRLFKAMNKHEERMQSRLSPRISRGWYTGFF